MNIRPFALERYFAQYEFTAKYMLSSSDCDGWKMNDILVLADDECKELWHNLTLGYTEPNGLPLLRQEIARLYTGITPEQVLVAVPGEAIFLLLNALLEPNDHVICTYPGYQSLYEVAESIGCSVTHWNTHEQQNWKFNIADLEQSIRPNTKLLIINFPHNPTGYLPSKAEFEQIIAVAKKHNIYVFSDEMYRYLEFNPADRLPAAIELYDRAISLFGMSKTFGMAGVRVGWLVIKDTNVYQKVATLKDYTTICNAAPSELLALIGLRAKETIINTHLNTIKHNIALLETFFAKHQTRFSWVSPKAGTIGFARVNFPEGAANFCKNLVEKTGVMLLPSTVYEYGDSHVRIGFGRKNLPEVLPLVDQFLKNY